MLGCELEAAYPVVPIADKHAVSVGMTTIRDDCCFGLYAASEILPDSDELAADVIRLRRRACSSRRRTSG